MGVDFFDVRDHGADDGARFAGRVRGGAHPPQTVEDDAGNGVHHSGEAFFGGALDFLEALGVRHRADMPDIVENGAGVGDEKRREFAVVIPGAGDGSFVNFLAFCVEEKRGGRDIGLGAVEADVALALLLGIVERMRVEEGPDELAADIF